MPEASDLQVYLATARAIRDSDLALLNTDEAARAARFRFERDRELFVLGRGLIRSVLGQMLSLSVERVPLRLGMHGKPELAMDTAPLSFNVSHSGNQVALIVGKCRNVGIDIESHIRSIDFQAVAHQSFCSRELESLATEANGAAQEFFRIWTLKEAWSKAVGTGLGARFSQIDVSQAGFESPRVPLCSLSYKFQVGVQSLEVPKGYCAAVAADGVDWRVTTTHWAWDAA